MMKCYRGLNNWVHLKPFSGTDTKDNEEHFTGWNLEATITGRVHSWCYQRMMLKSSEATELE